jgi:hypothetical protein
MDDQPLAPIAVPVAPVVSEPIAEPDEQSRIERAASWCDVTGCDLPCELLELVSIADCDLGCF